VRGHVFQHVRRRLNRPLTNLVHADFVPTVLTPHVSATRYASDPDVHGLRLRSSVTGAEGIGTATTDFRCKKQRNKRE
jgi:hypothetical protein